MKEARHQGFDNILLNFAREFGLYDTERSFAGTEAGQANFLLQVGGNALSFLFDISDGYLNVESVLTSFNQCHGEISNFCGNGTHPLLISSLKHP